MGYYVHIHVAFACDNNEPVAELAKKHLAIMDFSDCVEAEWFLTELSKRTGTNPGPKGGMSLWGVIGNYTAAEEFVEILRPFWREMLVNSIGPHYFEHIIVFEEAEQTEQAIAYEIFLSENPDDAEGKPLHGRELTIKKHQLPSCWGQF